LRKPLYASVCILAALVLVATLLWTRSGAPEGADPSDFAATAPEEARGPGGEPASAPADSSAGGEDGGVTEELSFFDPLSEEGQASTEPQRIPGQYIFVVTDSSDPSAVAQDVVDRHGGEVMYVYEDALWGFAWSGTDEGAEEISRDRRIASSEPDFKVFATAEEITPSLQRIRASHPTDVDAFGQGYTGDGIFIGILDTGVEVTHPNLQGNVVANQSWWRSCVGQMPPVGGTHGTAVAGIAAAAVNDLGHRGVAPQAKIIPIQVLSNAGSGTFSSVACGVNHLTKLARENPDERFIGNMSLSGTGPRGSCGSGFRRAVCISVGQGVVWTVSAGNSNTGAGSAVPASFPEVITTSALYHPAAERTPCEGEAAAGPCDGIASFSNFGGLIDVMAPGVGVHTSGLGGGQVTLSGTSASAPIAAGVAALMLQANAALSPADVRSIMRTSGECPDGSENGTDDVCPLTTGQWPRLNWLTGGVVGQDRDSIPEPLVHALRAAQLADPRQPRVNWEQPSELPLVGNHVPVGFSVSDNDADGNPEGGVKGVRWSVVGDGGWRGSWGDGNTPDAVDITEAFSGFLDSSSLEDGPQKLLVEVTDNDDNVRSYGRRVEVRNAPPLYVETFDDPHSFPEGWDGNGLWHINNHCVESAGSSPPGHAYFGDADSCTFDVGGAPWGRLVSPVFRDVERGSVLSFDYVRVGAESPRAHHRARLLANYGGRWSVIWREDARQANTPEWTRVEIPLNTHPTRRVARLNFQFHSGRGILNDHLGFAIDNVMIRAPGWNGAPDVEWQEPAYGDVVRGDVALRLKVDDEDLVDEGFDVQWRRWTGSEPGSWEEMTYNAGDGRFEATWDSDCGDPGLCPDGEVLFEVRATDSGGAERRSATRVQTNNFDTPPEIEILNPSDGAVLPAGEIPLRARISDDRTPPASLDVSWKLAGPTPVAGVLTFGAEGELHGDTLYLATLEPGSYTLTVEAVDDCPDGFPNRNLCQVPGVSNSSASSVDLEVIETSFSENFEGTTEDDLREAGWVWPGLWHISESCGDLAPVSGGRMAYFGSPDDCRYPPGNHRRALRSSRIEDLPQREVILSFNHFRNVERSHARLARTVVQVNTNGRWRTVLDLDARDPSDAHWSTASIPVTLHRDGFWVRFFYIGGPGAQGGHTGWAIDDLRVGPAPPAPGP
jgi:subtilisin